jgi:hypothetical protein
MPPNHLRKGYFSVQKMGSTTEWSPTIGGPQHYQRGHDERNPRSKNRNATLGWLILRQHNNTSERERDHNKARDPSAGYSKSVRYLFGFGTFVIPNECVGRRGGSRFEQTAKPCVHKDSKYHRNDEVKTTEAVNVAGSKR